MSGGRNIKFAQENGEPFFYGKIYEINENCFKIAADINQVDLLLQLTRNLNPPYFILYVLTVSRLGNELGRYQSTLLETKDQLSEFLLTFKDYFETDGRHHVWIGAIDDSGLLVYDQHNVIFAYGGSSGYLGVLKNNGFKEQAFLYPAPHAHNYHFENDKYEDQILNNYDWQMFPIQESDLYE